MSYSDCCEIVSACKRSNVILAVCHVLRYLPEVRKITELISSAALGDVVCIQHTEPVCMSSVNSGISILWWGICIQWSLHEMMWRLLILNRVQRWHRSGLSMATAKEEIVSSANVVQYTCVLCTHSLLLGLLAYWCSWLLLDLKLTVHSAWRDINSSISYWWGCMINDALQNLRFDQWSTSQHCTRWRLM